MTETGTVFEWRIENLSHWCSEVHGKCIKSPDINYTCAFTMELYPKGVSGQDEHLVVRLCGYPNSFSGELSFYCSEGSLLCTQQVDVERSEDLELPPGPAFEDVLSRIRDSGDDFITLKLRTKISGYYHQRLCTTIEVLKTSVNFNPRRIIPSNGPCYLCYILLSPSDRDSSMWLNAYSKNNAVQFGIEPPSKHKFPFAVDICMRLTRSDGTVDSCVRKGHVFHDKTPWTFPYPMQKKELEGKEISMSLCIKTSNVIHITSSGSQYKDVSLEPKTSLRCHQNETSTDLKKVRTKDSESQTCDLEEKTSCLHEKKDTAPIEYSYKTNDSVTALLKDFMCLFQDQDFFDITLKCDNVSFPVHKAILSARSPVFKSMLSTDMTEAASSEVVVEDLDPSTLSLFLAYLYTGAVEDLECDRALKLYYAADKYQVPSLKGECAKFLCDSVSVSTVCDILTLADKHSDDQLISASHEFILNNFEDVLKSSEWKSFMRRESLLAIETVTHFAEKGSVGRLHHSK